eukprot:scaffold5118_cov118-Isochrysis_galbana.AAC.8
MARSCFVRASCASASARSANLLRVHLQTKLGSKVYYCLGGSLCRGGKEDADGLMLAGGGGASISTCRPTTGDFLGRLEGVYARIVTENDRQSVLVKQQARLHLRAMFMHLDADHSYTLGVDELASCESFLVDSFPTLDMPSLRQLVITGATLADVENLIVSLQ